MALFIPGTITPKKRRAAMHAALYRARENRRDRVDQQIIDGVYYSASPPNPDAGSGTEGNGEND